MRKILISILFFGMATMISCRKDKNNAPDLTANLNGMWELKSEKGILTTGTTDTAVVKPGTLLKFTDSLYERYTNYMLVSKGTFQLSVAVDPKTHTKMQVLIFDRIPNTEVFVKVTGNELVYYNSVLNPEAGVLTFQKVIFEN